jgi:hypothetical protein
MAQSMAQRIFLVGCPRSGTTLIQGCLAAHREVHTFTESHFYDKGFKQGLSGRFRVRREAMKSVAEHFLLENEIGSAESRQADLDALDRTANVEDSAKWLVDVLDRERNARQCGAWIEKTPDHVWRIPLIARVSPDARFIHILREPQSTVKSLHAASKGWGAPKSWLYSFAHWRYSLACSARYAGQSAQHFMLFYEDFVRTPELWCGRLVSWLGLPADADLLARRVETTRRVISNNEDWKGNALQEIRPQGKTDTSSIPWSVRQLMAMSRCYSSLYRKVHATQKYAAEPAMCTSQAECS